MSLKAFHIVFIATSALLSAACGAWLIMDFAVQGDLAQLVLGVLSFAAAAGLVVYGRRFLHRLKHVRMM